MKLSHLASDLIERELKKLVDQTDLTKDDRDFLVKVAQLDLDDKDHRHKDQLADLSNEEVWQQWQEWDKLMEKTDEQK